MPDGQVHNLLFAASSHGTVYAFDADGNNPSAGYLWSINYIPSGERYAQASDYFGCSNPNESGIVGTPVIDRASQTMYFVTKSITTTGSNLLPSPARRQPHRRQRAARQPAGHRPHLRRHRRQAPAGTVHSVQRADPEQPFRAAAHHLRHRRQHRLDRLRLALRHRPLSRTSWSDIILPPWPLTAAFNNTPNANDGGVWGSSGGPAADAQGNIYVLGGNGTFDANTGGQDYGDTALKLVPPATGASSNLMTIADSFTPSNQATLQQRDLDLGGAEPLLFTDPASGVAPNLLVASDKNGYIYLINTANMGHYESGSNGIDGLNGDIQDFGGNGSFVWNFAFFNNTLFTGNTLRAYAYTPGTSTTAGSFNTTAIATQGDGGVAPVISANGTSNPILWLEDSGTPRCAPPPSPA